MRIIDLNPSKLSYAESDMAEGRQTGLIFKVEYEDEDLYGETTTNCKKWKAQVLFIVC